MSELKVLEEMAAYGFDDLTDQYRKTSCIQSTLHIIEDGSWDASMLREVLVETMDDPDAKRSSKRKRKEPKRTKRREPKKNELKNEVKQEHLKQEHLKNELKKDLECLRKNH